MATEYLSNNFLEDAIQRFKKSKQDKIRFKLFMEDINSSNEKRIKNKKEIIYDIDTYSDLYKDSVDRFNQSNSDLAISFMTLSEHLVRYAKDIIVDSDDAIQEGAMICFAKLEQFNPNYIGKDGKKAKAFNYMTTCILNHFRQIYRTDKHYRDLKERFKQFLTSRYNGISIRNGREIHNRDYAID
jgi:hypothetical protein